VRLPLLQQGLVGVLATVGPDGPHAIPVSAMRRLADDALVFALARSRGSLARLRAEPRVAMALVDEGFALTAHGEARVIAEPLPGADFMAAVLLGVRRLEDASGGRTLVHGGVRWSWADDDSARRDRQVLDALERWAAGYCS
jgi:hypothetical protein